MNYAEESKQKETTLINIRAKLIAKKQSFEEMLEKRKKAEAEVMSQLGITLAEVPSKRLECQTEIEREHTLLSEEVEKIESEVANIKC